MTTELIICPICNRTIWSETADPIKMAARIPSRSPHGATIMTDMVLESQRIIEEKTLRAETACVEHFSDHHPRRLSLWRRFRWSWLMTKRWPWSWPVVGSGTFEVKP